MTKKSPSRLMAGRALLGLSLALLGPQVVAGPAGAAVKAESHGDGSGDNGDSYSSGEQGNCNREGNCNDQRRCQGNNCTDNHKSFSPDLKDSPVTICMPGSTCYFDGNGQPKKGGGDQKPQSVGCLIPVPYHCDPKPKGQ